MTDLTQNADYLKEKQYKDSVNLGARAALHIRFSTAKMGWHPWVFDQLGLQSGETVLECGCGPAWLWRENQSRIPTGCSITLTDLSEGMVAEAEAAIKAGDTPDNVSFQFQPANIMELPFADATFDVVVANHMLYHVPDLALGLAEVRRVLRSNGRFLAATNGQNHMQELRHLAAEFAPEAAAALPRLGLSFRLDNGRLLLAPYFSDIQLLPYPDSLMVTEAQPLLDYLLSYAVEFLPEIARPAFTASVEKRIDRDGGVYITKEIGLFSGRKSGNL